MLSLSRGTPTGSWPEIQLAGPQNQGIPPSGRPPDDQRWQTAAAAVAGSSLALPAEMPSCEHSQLARPSWSRGAGYLGAGWSQARVGRGVFVVAERGSAAGGVSVKLVGAAVGATVVREASMVHAAVVHFQAGQEVGRTLKMAAATTAGVDARALHFLQGIKATVEHCSLKSSSHLATRNNEFSTSVFMPICQTDSLRLFYNYV